MSKGKERKPQPEVTRISSILTSVAIHLRLIHGRGDADLEGPIEAVENIVRHIDDGEPLP